MVKKSSRRTRRTHTPEFKARVAWPHCAWTWALAELCKRFELLSNKISVSG